MTGRPSTGDGSPDASPERLAIARLLRTYGIGRHALFLTQREGTRLPGGLEAVSGYVLDRTGHVFGFWLGWDDVGGRLALAPFWRVDAPRRAFANDGEYLAARRTLGLD